MCGIAGFVNAEARASMGGSEAILRRMCDVIRHRGPDDDGAMIAGGVALGMRRLAIIDLSGGHQPMSSEDGAVSIVFNGEIYNFLELQPELEARGHRFHTRSDTEVIIHSFEEYGPACVDKLRGMFAFAIWDARSRELFLARDRVGKKPLFYTLTPQGTFIFGSELKSLLEHPQIQPRISAEALDAYLSLGYVPDPLSIFHDIHKLPPAHSLTFRDGQVTLRQYWDFPYGAPADRSPKDWLEELRHLLAEAVRIRLISDVPLGAFLSGGVDSSTVVGLMAQAMDRPVRTFSIGYHEDSYNELKYARLAANKFATEHKEFIVTPDLCSVVDDLVWHLDEPFADSSAIPTYMVSKLARDYVTVVLSGDGGDELFAGYTRYVVERERSRFDRLPSFLRHRVFSWLSRTLPHGAYGRNFLHNLALDALDRYLDSVSVFTTLNKPLLYTAGLSRQVAENALLAPLRRRAEQLDPVHALMYLDSKSYLPGDILTKVDRMSMAASLEARAPLLDHKLIEFVCSIPASLKLAEQETKGILKAAVRDFVPPEILHREKHGFGVPINEWINNQLQERIRETLCEPRSRQRGYFDPRYVQVLLDEHERGRRDHAMQLWALFMLELWHRQYVDGAKPGSRPRAVPVSTS